MKNPELAQPKLMKRPAFWRIFARRRWERMIGTSKTALYTPAKVRPKRKPRKLKGIAGA